MLSPKHMGFLRVLQFLPTSKIQFVVEYVGVCCPAGCLNRKNDNKSRSYLLFYIKPLTKELIWQLE